MNEFKSCLGCTKRHVGCHATCKKHHDEKELHAQNVAKRKVDLEYNGYTKAAIARRPKKYWK